MQPRFSAGSHDSVQYHFFCDQLFCSVRAFRSESLDHQSAWVFDGSPHELLNSSERVQQSDRNHLDIVGPKLEISVPGAEGLLKVTSESSGVLLETRFTPRHTFTRADPFGIGEKTIHQPDLEGTVTYQGKIYKGIGFCKRYWGEYPRYWGYRFVHGVTEDHSLALWTADATFGEFKYDYFQIVGKDGSHLSADPNDSYQKVNAVYATIGKSKYEVSIEEIARWETVLLSKSMESLLRQRYCRMTLKQDGKAQTGIALNEVCYGTLG